MARLAINGGPKTVTEPAPEWPVITEEDIRAVMDAFKAGEISFPGGGGVLEEFERAFAAYEGRKYCIGVNGGTAALDIGVHLAGVEPGDEVIVSPYTWGATVGCILHNNAIPVFADIDPKTFTIDPEKIKEKITPRTKAIVVVHIFGNPADMDPIMEIAEQHGLLVIEDCAQACGTIYKGRKVGNLGHVGAFSLHEGKNFGAGEGGAVVLDDDALYQEAILFGTHPGRHWELKDDCYKRYSDSLGWNYRMHGLAAAFAKSQLARIQEREQIRWQNTQMFLDGLRDLPGVEIPYIRPDTQPQFHMIPLTYRSEELKDLPRDKFIEALAAEGVTGIGHYVGIPIHLRNTMQDHHFYGKGCPWECPLADRRIEYHKGDCPVAEERCEKTELDFSASRLGRECSKWLKQVIDAFHKVIENIDEIPRS